MLRRLALPLPLLLVACASTDGPAPTYEPKEYRTGSNIPIRDTVGSSSVQYLDAKVLRDSRTGTPRSPAAMQ